MLTMATWVTTLILGFILVPSIARSDCASPFGITGQIQLISSEIQFCDGIRWVGTSQGATAVSCPVTGEIAYDSGTENYRYCPVASGNWVNMKGALIGSSGGATAGTLTYDHFLHKLKMSNGTNWYKIANKSWTIEPTPDFGGYREKVDDNGNCVSSDIVTMSGITEPIEIHVEGMTMNPISGNTPGAIATGELYYSLNGGAWSPPLPIDGDAATTQGQPEYEFLNTEFTVNPGDTLELTYCADRWLCYPGSYCYDGTLSIDIYNMSVSDWDYLGNLELFLNSYDP